MSLNVLPRQRVKDTRAAVVAEAAGSTYIHPAALFALSQVEIAHHSEAPGDYSWGYGDTDDASDETTEEADGAPGAEDDSLGPEPDDDLDNLDSDENAHLDDEDPPIVQKRTRAPRGHAAAASSGTIHPQRQERGCRNSAPALAPRISPVLVTLEDYGFCPKGEGGAFAAEHHTGPGGRLALNTSSGQLSSFYMWGMTPVSEAVIPRLRGEGGDRQVPSADVALVSGNGGVLSTHSTLVLSRLPS